MSTRRGKSLDEIVSEALTLPPGHRNDFLREACEGEEHLLAEAVREVFVREAHEAPNSQDVWESLAEGEMIGPYRVIRSLGRGGMGEVFLAERADDQFRQQVAIKIVRPGVLSRHIQGRLRQERQILASLEHPNIARLYDGGTTKEGTPYLVMEYIEGEPIDAYCDERHLSIRERLQLFITVCGAVQRAHQRLIVHRDLKPSNILVTRDGVPKLLDFGIAKMLDDPQMMHTLAVTQMDVRVMTPDHASPEQIRAEPITTASDIYVLGILLYELLSGLKPYQCRNWTLAELERAICDSTPLAPSAAIANAAREAPGMLAEICDKRSMTPRKLQRELSGDLDNIIAVATRKEPERRYASVEQLAADLQNFLTGQPVKARPDAWTYRTGKFIRRHATVVALSAASLALLVGFSATTYVQSQRIAFERDQAELARVHAQSERERAEAVSEFLIESFRYADPAQARGEAITAREILDSGASRVSVELKKQPLLQAALLDTIGRVYVSLGLPNKAKPLVEEGLQLRRAFDPHGLGAASSLYTLSLVQEKSGELRAAEALARESLEMSRAKTGGGSLEVSDGLCRLGYIKKELGDTAAAESLFAECLSIREQLLGRSHEKVTIPLDNLARIAQSRGDLTRAEQLLQRVLLIDKATVGESHPRYITHVAHLASVQEDSGNFAGAHGLYVEALELFRRVLGPDHPETIDTMSALGSLLLDYDRLKEAEPILNETLARNIQVRGRRHPYIGNDYDLLGRLAFRKQHYAQAETYFAEALDIYRERLYPSHSLIASAMTFQGRAQLAQNELEGAGTSLETAARIWRESSGETSLGFAIAQAFLARTHMLQGRRDAAVKMLEAMYPIIEQANAPAAQEIAAQIRAWMEEPRRIAPSGLKAHS